MTPQTTNPATVRTFLLVEGIVFALAAAVHGGLLLEGWQHREAMIAETVIAVVLLGGLAIASTVPEATRTVGLVAQGFALVGTLVGIFTIIVGVGPRTLPDVIYHVAIVGVLAAGLVRASRLAPRAA